MNIENKDNQLNERQLKSKSDNQPVQAKEKDFFVFPLSYQQESLWFIDQLEPGRATYNIPLCLKVEGKLNIPALEKSLTIMIHRHEVLRTCFDIVNGEISQIIYASQDFKIRVVELSNSPHDERLGKAISLANDEGRSSFDLKKSPLFRCKIIKLDDLNHLLTFTFHHIIFDGWSVGIFIKELGTLYNNLTAGENTLPDEPPLQYADFTIWQRDEKQVTALRHKLDYWKEHLKDQESFLELPSDKPRSASQTFNGIEKKVSLSKELSNQVREFSRKEKKSLFMVLLAAYNILLYRYTGKTDITVGCPFANRNQPGLEDVMGFCMNMLPLRTTFSEQDSFLDVLDKTRDVALGAQANQEVSFEQIVEELKPARDASFNPLFQVSFMFQEPITSLPLNGINCQSVEIQSYTSRFDFTLWMWDDPEGLQGSIQYNTDLFEDGTVDRMFNNFSALLEDIFKSPGKKVSKLEVLSKNEKQTVISEWNKTRIDYPKDKCIHQLFESIAEKYPGNIAVEFENQKITYKELNKRANRLANYLQSIGIVPESLVGIFLERSIDIVVGLLGILKAGGAYVPLDPVFPKDRLTFMLQDAGITTLITQSKFSGWFTEFLGTEICLDRDFEIIDEHKSTNPADATSSGSLAYVIYTSGSTGRPKGVQIEHRSLVNFLISMQKEPGLKENDILLSVTTLSFDIAGLEIFLPLITGAKVVLVSKDNALDGRALLGIINSKKINVMQATPATFRIMLASGWNKKLQVKILCGGEPLPVDLAKELLLIANELWNMYGPTETTVWSTIKKITESDSIAIGKPIANTSVYILDANLKPVPIGATGELCIGGDGLARGYLNRSELTDKSFIADPFNDKPDSKIYKTGDLARYKSNGEIECLGRIDHQVKVRGFRIETGEIESVLSEHEAIKQSIVVVDKDIEGNARLVAYLTIEQNKLQLTEDYSKEQLSEWQLTWDDVYKTGFNQYDPTFNISGWKSSYTGIQIPDDEMREWVDNTVKNILDYKPDNILEIGCGTGLLLFRLAPACKQYTGIDFSQSVLNATKKVVQAQQLNNVTLLCREADKLENIENDFYDMVIINSVVQYFPGVDYMLDILRKTSGMIKPGGKIFIGDVRNRELLNIFALSVELHQKGKGIVATELIKLINKRVSEAEELLFDPQFFFSLNNHIPEISAVEVLLKRGKYLNELTKYRYDVILHIGETYDKPASPEWIDFSKHGIGIPDIELALKNNEQNILAIKNIPNSRIFHEVNLYNSLTESNSLSTVAEHMSKINKNSAIEIDPEELYELGNKYNFITMLTRASGNLQGHFDAVFQRSDKKRIFNLNHKLSGNNNLKEYVNNPLIPKFKRALVPFLKEFLKGKLPDYMIPSMFMLLDEMPLTPNGKIDRKNLRAPDDSVIAMQNEYIPPRDELELQLVSIWQKVLGVKKIGMNDNFFDLGGHSLLAAQLFALTEKQIGKNLPLAMLFQTPTVGQIAEILRKDDWQPTWSSLVPIRTTGSKPPLFLIHGAEGNVLLYRDLANYLGEDQPVYGFQSKGLDGKEDIATRFPEMAANYILEMKKVQQDGPYLLGGYCMGGALAYEMAQQLKQNGDEVALLALLESYNIREAPDRFPFYYRIYQYVQHIGFQIGNIILSKSENRSRYFKEKTKLELSRYKVKLNILISKLSEKTGIGEGLNYAYLMIVKINHKAQAEYIPTEYNGKVALFKPKRYYAGLNDPSFGWGKLTFGGIEIIEMPINPRGILNEPFVKDLAQKLKEEINQCINS